MLVSDDGVYPDGVVWEVLILVLVDVGLGPAYSTAYSTAYNTS